MAIFSLDKNIPASTKTSEVSFDSHSLSVWHSIYADSTTWNADGLSRPPQGPDQAFAITEAHDSKKCHIQVRIPFSLTFWCSSHSAWNRQNPDLLFVMGWVMHGNWSQRLWKDLTYCPTKEWKRMPMPKLLFLAVPTLKLLIPFTHLIREWSNDFPIHMVVVYLKT